MYFYVDEKRKIIFGWSPKCGCTNVKRLFNYFQEEKVDKNSRYPKEGKYKTILFVRNPYKRIVSGFLQKYVDNHELKQFQLFGLDLTFEKFVEELDQNGLKRIEKHHFKRQTDGDFEKRIVFDKIFDIEKIDFEYLEELFGEKIPKKIKYGIKKQTQYSDLEEECFNWPIKKLLEVKPKYQFFYQDDIKKKVFQFYKKDFIFFKENGFTY